MRYKYSKKDINDVVRNKPLFEETMGAMGGDMQSKLHKVHNILFNILRDSGMKPEQRNYEKINKKIMNGIKACDLVKELGNLINIEKKTWEGIKDFIKKTQDEYPNITSHPVETVALINEIKKETVKK